MSSKTSALFDQNDWKLKVTDIDLYANTCKLDGESYPLSLALKTLIPGYVSGFSPRAAEPMELQKAERHAYGDSIRNAMSSTGRSRAAKLVEIDGMDNWMDSL